eukprot:gene34180-44160_t
MKLILQWLLIFLVAVKLVKSEVIVEESNHPYSSSQNTFKTFSVVGAVGYKVSFSNCSTASPDGLTFYTDSSHTNFWGSFRYSGDSKSGAWGSFDSYKLHIYAPSFVLNFYSNSNTVDWGYLLLIEPIMSDAEMERTTMEVDSPHNYYDGMNMYNVFSIPGAVGYSIKFDKRGYEDLLPTMVEVDSPHNYYDVMNMYNVFSIPGAVGYSIKFDKRGYVVSSDGLILYKDSSYTNFWGSFWYAGDPDSGAWGSSDDYSLTVYASKFYPHFYSTSATNNWGFKMYITPIMSEEDLLPTMVEVDSPHNYYDGMNMYNVFSIPGATSYMIKFDEINNVLSGDYLSFYTDASHKYNWGDAKYSGNGSWNSLTVLNSTFVMYFYSTSSSNEWGFKAYIYPIA